ncbi:hypothetical protein OUZ56_003832 [Daphnia magna]|uniref:Uncharacterized protein n=1 Tax=Daphnia magna TaxID=35525 RepID=A0ABQ9YMX5_9CRUS|nr:hypothetical protein OUZ56_003832 [Daphnia magna]
MLSKRNQKLEDGTFVSRRHPSTEPWVIDDIHSGHDCIVNWCHFYKAKQNYVASLLHWTADLDNMSTMKEIMCLNENGSPKCVILMTLENKLTVLKHLRTKLKF